MKLLVISKYSGAVNPIRPEAEIFLRMHREKGVEITVLSPADKGVYVQKLRESGIEVIDFLAKSKFNVSQISYLRSFIKKGGFDIVHCFYNNALALCNWACIGLDVKLLAYRGYTGNIFWYDPSCYLTYLNPRVDYITCLAESVREVMLKNMPSKSKPVTINKGHSGHWYDDVKEADLSEFNLPENAMVCSFVANARNKMKGLNFLIESTYSLPTDAQIYLLLMGNELDGGKIRELAENSPNRDKIIFAGYRSNVNELVKACDVAISVSLYGEATQKAMIEAMYLATPVLITDISGNRNMAEDGKSGFVIPPADSKAIAEGLLKFWRMSKTERLKMGEEARRRIGDILSIEKSVENYYAFYQKVIA